MMAKAIILITVLIAVIAEAVVSQRANGTEYVVGDSLGWTIPPDGSDTYASWASKRTFNVGDTIVFNFFTREDDVAQVMNENNFEECDSKDPTFYAAIGPAFFKINTTGNHYFISTYHCSLGQKVVIRAIPSSIVETPSLAPTSESGTEVQPLPESSAKSLGAIIFYQIFTSIFIAFLVLS